jgi:predicted TIM-barrel enzyme
VASRIPGFGRRVFLPVLHLPFGPSGLFESVAVAQDAGCDGVFLINQGMGTAELLAELPRVKERHSGLWVGVNLLGYDPAEILRLPEASLLDGLWADDAGVDAMDAGAAAEAQRRWQAARQETGWRGLYFGGTAFKTQAPVPPARLAEVGRRAAAFVDVVTTSGPATGRAAPLEKVLRLREALGEHPMALASGVTPENVREMLPHVDAFLVATGIEQQFGRLDPARTRALADLIHAGA